MDQSSSGIFVAHGNGAAFVRVLGRGSYQNSQPLRQFGQDIVRQGCHDLFIDLAQCQAMDSTFLGVLAGFGLALCQRTPAGSLHLINVPARHSRSLQMLGLNRVASIAPDEPDSYKQRKPDASDFTQLSGSDLTTPAQALDKAATAELMLECHEDLCRADEQNEARFKDVKQFLREDIQRSRPDDKKSC